MNQERCLVIFVKYPEKGKVKSRLILGEDASITSDLYLCFIKDLLERISDGYYRLLMAFDPPEKEKDFTELFGNGFSYMPQEGTDLGIKMYNAFVSCFAEDFRSAVIIGSDSPDISQKMIEDAFHALESHDAVIGPTWDGGYYLIGFSRNSLSRSFFENMTWSTDSVYAETIRKFDQEGISFHVLPRWRDIDTVNDLKALLKDCEHSDFSKSKTVKFLKDKGFAERDNG